MEEDYFEEDIDIESQLEDSNNIKILELLMSDMKAHAKNIPFEERRDSMYWVSILDKNGKALKKKALFLNV